MPRKIKICCDNHANIHSKWTDVVDVRDLGCEPGEWDKLTEEEKFKLAYDFVVEGGHMEIWYEEVE